MYYMVGAWSCEARFHLILGLWVISGVGIYSALYRPSIPLNCMVGVYVFQGVYLD